MLTHLLRARIGCIVTTVASLGLPRKWVLMVEVQRADRGAESGQLLLLVSGLPAVGKSAVVSELGPLLNATQLSRDEVRRSAPPLSRLVDAVAFRVLRRRLAGIQYWATAGLLDKVAVELRADRCVIVEALAEPQLRHDLAQLATAATARFVVVECRCEDKIEYARRLATRPRHWKAVVRRLEKTHSPADEVLSVDTSGSSKSSADAILTALGR
jgi:predicted kinase